MHFNDTVSFLKKISNKTSTDFYIVGGCVRDHLLRQDEIDNLDITVVGDFGGFLDLFVKELNINMESVKKSLFNTAVIDYNSITIDLVQARREVYEKNGSLPKVFPSNLDNDLLRRDFTINSIAFDVRSGDIIDPLCGKKDIENRIIKANRSNLFTEDPTRIFRYLKYMNRLSFKPDLDTKENFEESLENETLFDNVSKSRISKEWQLILKEEARESIISDLHDKKVFKRLFKDNVKCVVSSMPYEDSKALTLKMFYDNDTEALVKIMDTLMNGMKKREEAALKKMKTESGFFDDTCKSFFDFIGNKRK